MRSIDRIYRCYYITEFSNISIFKSISNGYYVPYYSIRNHSFFKSIDPTLMSNDVRRIFLTRTQVRKLIKHHSINSLESIDRKWVNLNLGGLI